MITASKIYVQIAVDAIEFPVKLFAIHGVFSRYDLETDEVHKDMHGEGIIFLAVDCVTTELPKEVGNSFSFRIFYL